MAVTKSPLDGEPIHRTWGHMEPAHSPEPAKVIRALDARCPACQSLAGSPCATGRMSTGRNPQPLICSDRINLARLMADSGKLEVIEQIDTRCNRCGSYSGYIVACASHRCATKSCTRRKLDGHEHCEIHKRGPKTKMTSVKISKMRRLRELGLTQAAIAQELGVSVMTISTHLKADRASASS